MPSLSIVIPAYNAEKHLNTCLQSVIAAIHALASDSCLACDVYVVDDASTDHTAQVLDTWTRAHDRIKTLRHADNKGAAAARNTAVAKSESDWILFLDADNVLYPHSLSVLRDQFVAHAENDVWVPAQDLIDSAGQRLGDFYSDWIKTHPKSRYATQPDSILLSNFIDTFSLVRRSLVAAEPFNPDLRFVSDWDLWIRLILKRHAAFGFIDMPLGGYRVHAEQITSQTNRRSPAFVREHLRVLAEAMLVLTKGDITAPDPLLVDLTRRMHDFAAMLNPAQGPHGPAASAAAHVPPAPLPWLPGGRWLPTETTWSKEALVAWRQAGLSAPDIGLAVPSHP
ncbi:MAG: glycosyltransferase family 2 protein, partial [Burkholderiaceae bacterium]|nr:glycosyltransferase family 2 protein [Burkholderiaceae bacterium]